ncbi:MAG TPA: serine protease [Leptolinea sp.]
MITNKKFLFAALILVGLFGVCLLTSLIYLFSHSSEKTPVSTIQTQITERPLANLPKQNPTVAQDPAKRSIPYQSVVLITALYRENGTLKEGWTGSGTFISSDGLILTNAHVVLSDKNFKVDALSIAPTINMDEKPQPAYFASVLQADARLDLAVLKITSDLNGNPVDSSTLNFPSVVLGDSDKLTLGDKLTILGYPGIGGDTITLTSGEVAGFTGESAYGNRAYIKTSATIAGGNSGGLAADDAGELVGIPTQLGSGSETGIVDCRTLADTNRDGVIDENDSCVPTGGFINSLRPANLAIPLIEAARKGQQNIVADTIVEDNQTPQTGNILHTDNFSDSSSGWTIQTDPDGTVGYVNNQYQIKVINPKMIISGTSGYTANNVVLDITAQIIQPSGQGDFGLICRQQSDGSYYAFEVSEDGYASIWKNKSGKITPLVDWKSVQELQGKTSLNLTAACVGNQLGLGVDNQLLISTTDDDFQEGDTGLIAGTWDTAGLIVAFDNFEVRSPK